MVYSTYVIVRLINFLHSTLNNLSIIIALRAIKLLATVTQEPSSKDVAMNQLQEWLQDGAFAASTTLQFVGKIKL